MFKHTFTIASLLTTLLAATDSPPARIQPRDDWGVYTDVSFLYWQAMQQNMELGIVLTSANGVPDVNLNSETNANPGRVVNMNFDYHPGFQVGLGANFDYDQWDALAEYTWFHGTNTRMADVSGTSNQIAAPFALFPAFNNMVGDGATGMTESWNLKLDFVDATLGRTCWAGEKLTLRPFFGARGAWIRQTAMYTFINARTGIADALLETSRSWGIGPSFGLDGNWMLGHGIRFLGTVSADLLYTWYSLHQDGAEFTNLVFSADELSVGGPGGSGALLTFILKLWGNGFSGGTLANQMNVTQKHIAFLQPHANLDLGFGWGSYFSDDRWHFDLSASYGFQVFWDQNMFRHFDDATMQQNSTLPSGNLYVHGLTATARFDY